MFLSLPHTRLGAIHNRLRMTQQADNIYGSLSNANTSQISAIVRYGEFVVLLY